MRKWNMIGLAASVAFSSFTVTAVLPQKAAAQEITAQEETETVSELLTVSQEQTPSEAMTQEQEQTPSEAMTQEQEQAPSEATTQEQEQTLSEAEAETKLEEPTVSAAEEETEVESQSEVETETGLFEGTTEAVPDNYFEDFTSATTYLREQLAQHQTDIEVVVVLDYELSEDEMGAWIDKFLKDAMAQTGSFREGDAISSDFVEENGSAEEVTDGTYWGYIFDYTVTYKTDSQQERELEQAILNKVIELCAGNPSDYERVRQIYDYICSTVKYDTTSPDEDLIQYSAYAAMQRHMATSEGYAALFYRMCQQAGVSARIVSGTANGETREWNIVNVNGNWYNVDCAMDAYDNPLTRNYQWFLKSDADFGDHVADDAWWNPTEAFYTRSGVSYDVPQTDRSFVGLAYVDGVWYYYQNGGVDEKFGGLVAYNGAKYLVQNGTINWDYTGLVFDNGTWRFVQGGCLNEGYTGLTNYYGTWYYVENGTLNWGYSGLANYNGSWYAIENGRLNWNYNGLMKYRGTWYYIHGGCLDWNYTGLTNYYGTWYYVYKGALNWGYSGLIYYNSAWYYVESGVMNWGYTGLTLYKGCWYYVEGSIIRWNYTGLVEYYGKQYYVEKSAINWNYNGSFVQDGVEYQVRYGTVIGEQQLETAGK